MELALLLQPIHKTWQVLQNVFNFGAGRVHLLYVLLGMAEVILPLLHVHRFLHVYQMLEQGFGLLLKDPHLSSIKQIQPLLHILHLLRHILMPPRWLPVPHHMLDTHKPLLQRIQLNQGAIVFL